MGNPNSEATTTPSVTHSFEASRAKKGKLYNGRIYRSYD